MRNNFEKKIYQQLVRKFGKANVEYEPIKLDYTITASYVPDFRVLAADGSFLVESKGHFRKDDMRKLRAVSDSHPEIDLRLLFYKDKKYCKTMSYSDWADRYGFPYAIDNVPKEWS